MDKRLKEYIEYIAAVKEGDEELKNNFLLQLSFFQHERLIHLLVLILFTFLAIVSIISSFITEMILLYLMDLILLIVLLFYIRHYYKLENGVQRLYSEYDRLFDKR